MFGGFEKEKDEQARKRWFASGGISLVIYALVGVVVIYVARSTVKKATAEPPIDVSFRSSVEADEAPPPPPPPPPPTTTKRPKRPGKPAPARPTMIPEERPEEGDPTGGGPSEAFEEFGDGELGGLGTEAGPPPPPPPPPPKIEAVPDPIDEVDPSVTPAKAIGGNAAPEYPKEARGKGLEADVVLRITISERGAVIDVDVLSGDEPFASAASAAVRTWRYRPATVDGSPVPVKRKVKIPFRIQT